MRSGHRAPPPLRDGGLSLRSFIGHACHHLSDIRPAHPASHDPDRYLYGRGQGLSTAVGLFQSAPGWTGSARSGSGLMTSITFSALTCTSITAAGTHGLSTAVG